MGPEGIYVLGAQSCPTLCDLWAAARQAPPSMGVSRPESWSGLPCPPLGYLPNPGIEPRSPALWGGILYHLSYQGSPEGIGSTLNVFFLLYINFALKIQKLYNIIQTK